MRMRIYLGLKPALQEMTVLYYGSHEGKVQGAHAHRYTFYTAKTSANATKTKLIVHSNKIKSYLIQINAIIFCFIRRRDN